MYYQLPTGKTVYLTVEEYLNLTDDDIQYMIACDMGESILNPFKSSSVNIASDEEEYDFDFYIDDEDIEDPFPDEKPFDDIIDITQ